MMYARGHAGNDALARRPQEIALELDGRKVLRPFGQVSNSPIAAACISQGDDGRGVQVSVRGEQFGADGQAACQSPRLQAEDFDADQARQVALSACVELADGGGHG